MKLPVKTFKHHQLPSPHVQLLSQLSVKYPICRYKNGTQVACDLLLNNYRQSILFAVKPRFREFRIYAWFLVITKRKKWLIFLFLLWECDGKLCPYVMPEHRNYAWALNHTLGRNGRKWNFNGNGYCAMEIIILWVGKHGTTFHSGVEIQILVFRYFH